MKNQVVLFVDERYVDTQQVLDLDTGAVREFQESAADVCRESRIRGTPMTPELKDLILYQRKAKGDGTAGKPVRLGDLGAFVLARVVDGAISNEFSPRNLGKPIPLSADMVRGLARIFGGNDKGLGTNRQKEEPKAG